MKAIVNIGMNVANKAKLSRNQVTQALMRNGIEVHKAFMRAGWRNDEEDTLIAVVEASMLPQKLYNTAEQLEQDAIALYDLEEVRGMLVGPRYQQWNDGAFDVDLFHLY